MNAQATGVLNLLAAAQACTAGKVSADIGVAREVIGTMLRAGDRVVEAFRELAAANDDAARARCTEACEAALMELLAAQMRAGGAR